MKRLVLVAVVAGVAGATGIYFWQQSRAGSVSTVTALLPHDTAALVHLPDCNRLRDDWHKSELYQLYREPAVQEFFRQPLGQTPQTQQWRSTADKFAEVGARDLFVAVPSVANGRSSFICGFRFRGDAKGAEQAVSGLRVRLLGQSAATPVSTENYGQHKIDIYAGRNMRIAAAYRGDWFFAADRVEDLKAVLDRADGHATAATSPSPAGQAAQATLATNDAFRSAVAEMPSDYGLLIYLDPKPFRSLLATWWPNQSAALDQVDSVCATSRFDKGRIHDVLFVGTPEREGHFTLTRKSASLGNTNTFLYTTALLNVSSGFTMVDPAFAGGMFAGIVDKVSTALARARITMADWQAAFGSEASLLAEWPAAAHWPSAVAVFPVRDFEHAKSLSGVIARASDEDADWREFDRDGVHYLSAQAPASLFVLRPTIAVSQQVMVAGVDPGSVEAAVQRSIKPTDELTSSARYKSAVSEVGTPNSFFAYVDPALLYNRLDSTLRPLLGMGAAFLPGLSNYVDLGHTPPADVVAKHLGPIVSSQRHTGHGYVTESIGPITLSQTGMMLLLMAGSGSHPAFPAIGPGQNSTASPSPDQTP